MNPQHVRRSLERWHWGILAAGSLILFLNASSARALDYANSLTQWSATGSQSENNWFYGYHDVTANGVYNGTQLIPFVNEFGAGGGPVTPTGNHWTGTFWNLADADEGEVPWTELGSNFAHPNGTNSGGVEHWVIRRWESTLPAGTAVGLEWTLRKTNTGGGNGTCGVVYVNGVQLDTACVAGNDGVGIMRNVGATLNPGDLVDLALTPNVNDGADGSDFQLRITDNLPPPPPMPPVADSFDDWSSTGTQGERNWFNGWRNYTADGGGPYDLTKFIPFVNGGGPISPTNNWTGDHWRLEGDPGATGGPWTELLRENTHPNGTNSQPLEEHWTIRRWEANVTQPTPLALEWHVREVNAGGSGVEGRLAINGVEVDAAAIAGGNTTGVTRTYYANLNPGDVVDLALGPTGPSGDRTDGADGSASRLTIRSEIPAGATNPGRKIADSSADFSGNQGQAGWFYGYYDQRADVESGNGVYDAGTDLTPFLNDGSNVISANEPRGTWVSSPNHWDGDSWNLVAEGAGTQGAGNEHGPWTEIDAGGGHPAANAQDTPEVHWFVRRWESTIAGPAEIMTSLNTPAPCGDGTVGRIFLNGVQIYSQRTFQDTHNATTPVVLAVGDILDFAVDPDGAGVLAGSGINAINDGCDSTTFTAMIGTAPVPFVPIPEPSTYAMAGLGMLLAGWIARRRGKR